MTLELFAHPFSSYCWKVLIALYEKDLPFTYRLLDGDHADNFRELINSWPLGKFPMLRDGVTDFVETSIIIEYLDNKAPGPHPLIPAEQADALETRLLDRVFDLWVMNQAQAYVNDALRPEGVPKDPYSVTVGHTNLIAAYDWLEGRLRGREWANGVAFSMADCAAAPALFYADWIVPFARTHPALHAYRTRLLARPSIARAIDEARPYRSLFPLGAPDRD